MGHNVELTSIRQQKRCIECGKKARTISQPNDEHSYSRVSHYRIVCDRCKTAFLVILDLNYNKFTDKMVNA